MLKPRAASTHKQRSIVQFFSSYNQNIHTQKRKECELIILSDSAATSSNKKQKTATPAVHHKPKKTKPKPSVPVPVSTQTPTSLPSQTSISTFPTLPTQASTSFASTSPTSTSPTVPAQTSLSPLLPRDVIAVTNNEVKLDPLDEVMKHMPTDVLKEDIVFAANKTHFTEISRMFDTIKALAQVIHLKVNDRCIVGECIDKSQTVMISVWLERFGFQNYFFNSPVPLTVILNIEELTVSIKNVSNNSTRNSSTITFFQQLSNPDSFGVTCNTDNALCSTTRALTKLKVPTEIMLFKDIQLCGAVQVNIAILKSALNNMKNEQSSDVSFTIYLHGKNIKNGAPNVDVNPVLKIRSCSEHSPCVIVIKQAQFIVPTTFEISNDQTAAMVMKNARWRDGCVPRLKHLQRTPDGSFSLPPFKYTRDILCKISSTQTNDDHVSIYFDRMGSLLFRYNVGLVGAVLFLVTPNMTMDEVVEMQETNCFGCVDDPVGSSSSSSDDDESDCNSDADGWE